MSVFVQIPSGRKVTVPLDKDQIQNYIDQFIREGNLVLRHITFAGTSYPRVSDISNLQDGSTIILYTYQIIKDARGLMVLMASENGGWQQISKSKPVATLESGQTWWFTENYPNLSPEQKTVLKNMLKKRINNGKDYRMELEIYVPADKKNQFFFYVPEFLSIACEIVGCTVEQGMEYISDFGITNPQKDLLISLVFGDYYKDDETKASLRSNPEFMRVLNEYNHRVGLPEQTGGNYSNYKEKYLKYKQKYLELKKVEW